MAKNHFCINASVKRDHFVTAMRTISSSVCVVTTSGQDGHYGATITAFSSVSADPPTILVCLRSTSRIADQVSKNGHYCLNILPNSASSIADRFAGKDTHLETDRFHGISWNNLFDMFPIIHGATALGCEVDQEVISGSHKILIGNVKEITMNSENSDHPLAYYNGSYHKIGSRIIENNHL